VARKSKLVLALGVTVALHAAVLFYALGPGLSGFTQNQNKAEAELTANSDDTLDIDWPQLPSDETDDAAADTSGATEPDKLTPAASIPTPAPAVAAKPTVVARPEPEPVAEAPAKPAKSQPSVVASSSRQAAASASAPIIASADSNYAGRVRQHLARFAGTLPQGVTGEARVQFVVQPDGQVSDVVLVKRSGHLGLDTLALNLPRQAQPLPLPGGLPQRLEVPVQAVATPTP
jgi:TonB family protein